MMILTDKKPRVNVEGILTADEIHEIEHHIRSEEHTSELQSHHDLVCRLLLEKKKTTTT